MQAHSPGRFGSLTSNVDGCPTFESAVNHQNDHKEHRPFEAVSLFLDSAIAGQGEGLAFLAEVMDEELISLTNDSRHLFSAGLSRLQFLHARGRIDQTLYHMVLTFKDGLNADPPDTERLTRVGVAAWTKLVACRSGQVIPDLLERAVEAGMLSPPVSPSELSVEGPVRISITDHDQLSGTYRFAMASGSEALLDLDAACLRPKQAKHLAQCIRYHGYPVEAYAHGLTKHGVSWRVDSLVLLPDCLVDVTAIASCFSEQGGNPLKHFVQLFTYRPIGLPALIGNAVNHFLDELIIHPEQPLDQLMPRIFQQNPLAFSLLKENEVEIFEQTCALHYEHVAEMVRSRFEGLIPDLGSCLLEPSFFSVEYGIQGRLDLCSHTASHTRIVELKSGKPFRPNRFGLNADHYAQTLLYYLLIRSVFGSKRMVEAHVFYSSQSTAPLRTAPPDAGFIEQLVDMRNALILVQLHLAHCRDEGEHLLDRWNERVYGTLEVFARRDARDLEWCYQQLSPVERDYFREFSSYVAREQFIARTGRSQNQYAEGLASLWLLSETEKREQFMLLSGLRIVDRVHEPNDYPLLSLGDPLPADQMANFRIGDTLILYRKPSVLKDQIFKCTLVELRDGRYLVRLRTRQFPEHLATGDHRWNLEHDSLDRSFLHQFQSISAWAAAPVEVRQRLLGMVPPAKSDRPVPMLHRDVPQHIRPVLERTLMAKDYFLVWGPPGSGKTSMVIRFLADALANQLGENILLLAYTNRAVDEICEALEQILAETGCRYLRIGSRYAVQEKFRSRLLDEQIRPMNSRGELAELLKSTRIFAGTVASIQGKKELFFLKKFDTVVVDEASQILEPQLIGLLAHFHRFVLIGDHMQLPAVSAQTPSETQIASAELRSLGFTSGSTSLFERLYGQCKRNGWDHAYEMLHYQGRMHYEIMQYPAKTTYDGRLSILPAGLAGDRQTRALDRIFINRPPGTHPALYRHRTVFVPLQNRLGPLGTKSNTPEARLIAKLVASIHALYRANSINWQDSTLGIITPFRAQIALIRHELSELFSGEPPLLTTDTAERYQGGARDIIILSTVVSDPSQLVQMTSVNDAGVDRKLNVAITRAREQVIIVGDPAVLCQAIQYNQLIGWFETIEPDALFANDAQE
ncbi:MAG: RecBCD enzyme subunit RecD [Saprospiraceae bacterium]|jgi:DNA replication ATP-dependent helicase Dna2|nr:RecBCD enzyme subunit RecD [Saprospiraceae bacterium]